VIARNSNGSYSYEYNLSDHLGNVRVTFKQSPLPLYTLEVLQMDDYCAFGVRKPSFAGSNDNKYLYNSKELQQELGPSDPTKQFYVDDFAGKGASYNAGISTPIVDMGTSIGGSLGLSGALLNPKNFGKNVNGYTTDQASFSPGTGAGFSIMYSNSTTVLFGRKK